MVIFKVRPKGGKGLKKLIFINLGQENERATPREWLLIAAGFVGAWAAIIWGVVKLYHYWGITKLLHKFFG